MEPPDSVSTNARFTNLQFHAAGGLGEVYRATEESLSREVALKFIQPRHGKNADYLSLFLLEAEVTSRLDHPGVVPVFGLGEGPDKRPFYAMRFIEGVQFREAIDKYHASGAQGLELHRLLNHLIAVCNTVAYAHNRGIVHCDIKPENIMLGKFGETLLVDWGLATPVERDERARASGEKTIRTQGNSESGKSSGGTAGTVGYMSPEQHPGHLKPITPACDIYSLGATLYCILTGKPPLQGAEETLLLDKLHWGDFPKPTAVNPATPPALEAICLKAMATHRAERYVTAQDLAADLEAWLADETVSVYTESFFERVIRWGRKNLNWVISGLIAAVMVLAVTLLSAVDLSKTATREARARVEAEEARKQAESARKTAEAAQQNGMRLAARFAARAVASEIDLRWRILTQEAADPELQRLMLALQETGDKTVGSPEQQALQQWLESRHKAHADPSESWLLTDAHGMQIARDPFNAKTIFVDYSDRTYFHGGPRPLTAEEKKTAKPITGVHLSTVYLSAASASLKVTFSVPVWKENQPQGECLGVLGMSVELNSFHELHTDLNAGQIAVLVDTREDHIVDVPASGLILHHDAEANAPSRQTAASKNSLSRIPAPLVEQLRELRKVRAQQKEQAAGSSDAQPLADAASGIDITAAYQDPLSPPGSPPVTAAFEPVRIESRPAEVRDTGWVVIVQESPVVRAVVANPPEAK